LIGFGFLILPVFIFFAVGIGGGSSMPSSPGARSDRDRSAPYLK
jgi:hypothetical protein